MNADIIITAPSEFNQPVRKAHAFELYRHHTGDMMDLALRMESDDLTALRRAVKAELQSRYTGTEQVHVAYGTVNGQKVRLYRSGKLLRG